MRSGKTKAARIPKKAEPRSPSDRLATAHHEAGHAVVATHVGMPVTHLSVVARGDGALGVCGHLSPMMMQANSRREIRQFARGCILICYAGIPAQRLIDPNPKDFHGESDDLDAFRISQQFQVFPRFMQYVGDEYHWAYLERLRREAVNLVRRHSLAIRHLAAVLVKKKEMTGDQVEETLAGFDVAS